MWKKGINLIRDLTSYFYQGWKAARLRHYFKSFFKSFIFYFSQFRQRLQEPGYRYIHDKKIEKLKVISQGLHNLLPKAPGLTFSVLIVITKPSSSYFKIALESVLNQSLSPAEILIGYSKPLEGMLADLKSLKLTFCEMPETNSKWEMLDKLAQKATGHFLFIMGEEDWMRPDLLYRYEQVLRALSQPEKRILYCNWNQLSRYHAFVAFSEHFSYPLHFPYVFKQFTGKGLLLPASFWNQITKPLIKGAEEEDLILQLDLKGALFQHIPLPLYSVRDDSKENKSQTAFISALEKYTQDKQLGWQWGVGHHSTTARALPPLPQRDMIQVIVPYKDQKELTLKCIKSLERQQNVSLKITAVDNQSSDRSIAHAIQELGGEVISVGEPFNYSRLNNLAVKQTKTAKECQVLLFLNNDVELEPQALAEMLRWIHQPQIGMVGCRLNYPSGTLQHGGVKLSHDGSAKMKWEHIEKGRDFEQMEETKSLGIFDAVTAACAMIKKEIFLEVGGFDEIWYPIGYSDTHLACKLKAKGYHCFYTPYAVGVHHESVSRQSSIEDFENSWWLHELLKKNKST